MGKKLSAILKAGAILALALCSTNALADDFDACKETGGHTGEGTKNPGKSDVSIKDAIPNSIYHYEIWYQGGNNSMTYYPDGTFSAEWNNSNDFLARVGLKYNSDKTFEELSPISADFKFTKQSSRASYSYIGIYGWTQEPLSEYYITDDWMAGRPAPGQKKGEITVDGDTYDIYMDNRWNAPSILDHNENFVQYFSIRRHARQCGHIDITAHMKAWAQYGFKGKLYESKLLVEAGGGATGKIDFNVLRMQDANTIAAAQSSSSEAESSSSSEAASSSSAPASSSSVLVSSSSDSDAIPVVASFKGAAGTYQVFNMIGKFMGNVELVEGSSMRTLLKAKFGAATYIVKRAGLVNMVSVK